MSDSTEPEEVTPKSVGFENFVVWYVQTHGPVDYRDYDNPNPYTHCVSGIAGAFGREDEGEIDQLKAAVASAHLAGRLKAKRKSVRPYIGGKAPLPEEFRVTVRSV